MKLVTICIPTFNTARTVEETIMSLLNQTYKNIKIKVFDNCSEDNTVELVEKLILTYPNIELYKNESNIGGEANFTKCIEHAEGDYTAIFHSDDIYHSSIVEEQVEAISKNDLVAVATHANTIDMDGKITGERFIPRELNTKSLNVLDSKTLLNLTYRYGNFITCPSVMIKSDVLKNKISIWNGADYKTSADLDVWIRLSLLGKFGFISKKLINYRIGDVSFSYNLKKVRTHRHDLFLVLDKYLEQTSKEAKKSYKFLVEKDNAFRVINLLKTKQKLKGIEMSNPFKILSVGLSSRWHAKFYLAIVSCWFISKFLK